MAMKGSPPPFPGAGDSKDPKKAKKPGVDVVIAVGKPKEAPGGPPKFPGADESEQPEHPEPDADQQGGPSDHDADNRIPEFAERIMSAAPELAHPLGAFLEAIANLLGTGEQAPPVQQDQGMGGVQ